MRGEGQGILAPRRSQHLCVFAIIIQVCGSHRECSGAQCSVVVVMRVPVAVNCGESPLPT